MKTVVFIGVGEGHINEDDDKGNIDNMMPVLTSVRL